MKIQLRSKALSINTGISYHVSIWYTQWSIYNMPPSLSRLLYAVFVVSSENSTVAELAATLQADLSQLQAAASFACRLGWAVKLIDPASILQDPNVPGSPKSLLSDEEDGSHASLGSANVSSDGAFLQVDIPWTENNIRTSGYARVAFLVDANITSYLMMGSVSPGFLFSQLYFCVPYSHNCDKHYKTK